MDSILPGLALHAGGDVLSLTRLWATGQPAWQIATTPPKLIWETGVDFAFVRSVIVFVLLGGAAVFLEGALTMIARGSLAARWRRLTGRLERAARTQAPTAAAQYMFWWSEK